MDALCLDILHSDWHDWRGKGEDEDRLLKAGWLGRQIGRWHLGVEGEADEETIGQIEKLRGVMQKIVECILQKQKPGQEELVELNRYLEGIPAAYHLSVRTGGYQLEQRACVRGWEGVPGEIALSFARLLAEDIGRIKKCENANCRWIYYDESANQTRRWCDDSCANLMRVRRFREKKREKGEK